MTVGIDAGALSIADERLKVGVYRVVSNLIRALGDIDKKNIYRLYTFRPLSAEIVSTMGERLENVVLPRRGFFSFWLPLELKRHPVDVFLGMAQAMPEIKSTMSYNVGFIYDLGFLFNPLAYGDSSKKLKQQTNTLVKFADHILAISRSVKKDILDIYQLSSDRITVSYPGIDEQFTSIGKKYVHPRPYFLFVGSLNKAKDLPFAIKSFAHFLKKIKRPYDFLLVGGEYWPDPEIDETIKKYKLSERVIKCGVVKDADLPIYYRGATALVASGLHEGFCLPVIEAQACGIPVLAVNRGALGEIVRDGGLVSAPGDDATFADNLLRVATDSELRQQLKQRAIINSAKFSWQEFTKTIVLLISRYGHKSHR